MALGQYPSLTEINTEIGISGVSLAGCILAAGKSGTWDRQSQFAYYSHASIIVTPSSVTVGGFITTTIATIAASSAWEQFGVLPSWINSVNPTSGTGTTCNIYFDQNESGDPRVGAVWFRLQSDTGVTDSILITQSPI